MRVKSIAGRVLALVVLLACQVFAQSRYLLHTVSPQDASRVTSQYGLTPIQTVREDDTNLYVVGLPPTASGKNIAAISADPGVEGFAPDIEVDSSDPHSGRPLFATSLDSLADALVSHTTVTYFGAQVRSGYVQQTATTLIQLAQSQQQYPTGNVTVAVIDTGVDPNHPAIVGALVQGYDFVNDLTGIPSDLSELQQSTVAILDQSTVAILDQKNTPVLLNQSTVAILDQSTVAILDTKSLPKAFGHGTMVSGLIHLVAPTAQIMPLKAFKANGTAKLSDVIRAIYYAVDHNAKVINMSFSYTAQSADLLQAIQYAAAHGVTSIASAGNYGREMRVYPAVYEGAIAVGSTNKLDQRSMFSDYGDSVRLSAPGEALVTTFPGNNYAAVWGTSFSTALVSGAAALVFNLAPSMPYGYVRAAFNQGVHLGEDLVRLELLPSLLFCQQNTAWPPPDDN
jgi:subtilisin family serine protease